jgi:hypothetical protein
MYSPPGRLVVNRWKTFPNSRAYDFSLLHASARIKARNKEALITMKEEVMVCQSLGTICNGQIVTEQTLAEFAWHFEDHVPFLFS